MKLADEPLPNPFVEGDTARDKLDELYNQVQAMQATIESQQHAIGLLMRAECIRIDRVRAKK